jgi:hypothetical protein
MESEQMPKTKSEYLAIIDEIEAVRGNNNKNWMDLLRLAFDRAPTEAAAIVAEIYSEDTRISSLAKRLSE